MSHAPSSPPPESSRQIPWSCLAQRPSRQPRPPPPSSACPRAQPIVGLITILGIAYAWSSDRAAIDGRTVAWGLGLQIVLCADRATHRAGRWTFQQLGGASTTCSGSPRRARPSCSARWGARRCGPASRQAPWARRARGMASCCAFQVLPTIIFIAALFAVLYYFGVMQVVVRLFAIAMRRVMQRQRRRDAQCRRQHLHGPDRSAAHDPSVPAAHDRVRVDDDDGPAWRTSPAASWRPTSCSASRRAPAHGGDHGGAVHTDDVEDASCRRPSVPETMGTVRLVVEADRRQRDRRGRTWHVGGSAPGDQRRRHADLVPRVHCTGQRTTWLRPGSLSARHIPCRSVCETIFGWFSRRWPGVWACRGRTPRLVGNLLGTRMALNEFVAYSQLAGLEGARSIARSFTIATYALCGFANFGSIGIQLGGIGAMVPDAPHRSGASRIRARCLPGSLATLSTRRLRGFPALSGVLIPAAAVTDVSTYFDTIAHAAAVVRRATDRRPRRRDRARLRPRRIRRARSSRSGGHSVRRHPALAGVARVGHAGTLVAGADRRRTSLVLSGRAHLYEGHALRPSRSRARARHASASGRSCSRMPPAASTRRLAQGTLMVIDDHINLMGEQSARRPERRPLRGRDSRT